MATLKRELREILDRYSIDPTDKSKLWDCHGTLVLYHRAYEIIAAKEGIKFDAPVMIEADSGAKIVAMLVTGRMGERVEWSVGEAAPGNNKNSYPYAIAEKRAKDRVVAKLVGLAEHVYSEDEADEFKTGARTPEAAAPPAGARNAPPPHAAPNGKATPTSIAASTLDSARRAMAGEIKDRLKAAITNAKTPTLIDEIVSINSDDLQLLKGVQASLYDGLMTLAANRKAEMYGGQG